jgi:hypothetical protein
MTEQELADYEARLLEQEAADVAAAKDEQLRLDKLYADTQAQEESLFKAEQERLNKELQDQIDRSNAELLAAQDRSNRMSLRALGLQLQRQWQSSNARRRQHKRNTKPTKPR